MGESTNGKLGWAAYSADGVACVDPFRLRLYPLLAQACRLVESALDESGLLLAVNVLCAHNVVRHCQTQTRGLGPARSYRPCETQFDLCRTEFMREFNRMDPFSSENARCVAGKRRNAGSDTLVNTMFQTSKFEHGSYLDA
jgi:hypothetical protein